MKITRKNKIDLLLGISAGNKSPLNLMDSALAKIYTEDVDEPGTYKTITGQPITRAQMDRECRHHPQIIVQVKTKGIPPIATCEEEIDVDEDRISL